MRMSALGPMFPAYIAFKKGGISSPTDLDKVIEYLEYTLKDSGVCSVVLLYLLKEFLRKNTSNENENV